MFPIIGDKLKRIVANLKSESVKHNLMQGLPYWTASIVAGLLAVLYAKLFSYVEEANIFLLHNYKWSLLIITPVCFILGWWVVKRFSTFARGSGIPQVMASIELATPKEHTKIDRLLSVRIIFIKIISSLIMVFGGAIIGREGPTIQIAGSVFRIINKNLPSWWSKISKKNMIITGAAAGLAAARTILYFCLTKT